MSIDSEESALEQAGLNELDDLRSLETIEQEQQNQQSDWTSGIDIFELGSGAWDVLADLLSGIDISF